MSGAPRRAGILVCLLLIAGVSPAFAQGVGSIFGKAIDTSGGVMPGVTVTVTGASLQQPLVATTAASGAYQFPNVPIGTYTVTFELTGFKKVTRTDVILTAGFNAAIDAKLEVGAIAEEVLVTAASPVVDLRKSNVGATFTADVMQKIPTARDPWQIINMAPGIQAGLNVGGSASGQQVGLSMRGGGVVGGVGGANAVQWNLEGGLFTDLSSNSSPAYFNFDSFEQIQVQTGGGDVSVQSGGIYINLVKKSGSNTFKGSMVGTFENDKTQNTNVTKELFEQSGNGFVSGAPINKITNMSVEAGGPILKDRLWYWGALDKQDINVGVVNFFDPEGGAFCNTLIAAQKTGSAALASAITFDKLQDVTNCLKNDKTVLKNIEWKFNGTVNNANKLQWLFFSDNKYRNARNASATRGIETANQQTSDAPWGFPLPTHQVTHTLIASDKLVFNNQLTYVGGGFFLDYQDVPIQGDCDQSRYAGNTEYSAYTQGGNCLFQVQALSNRTTAFQSRSPLSSYQTVRHTWELKTDGTYFASNKLGGDHSLKFGVGWKKAPVMTYSHYSGGARATVQCVGNVSAGCGTGTNVPVGSASGVVPYQAVLYRDQLKNNNWWAWSGYLQDGFSHGRFRVNGGIRYDWQQSTYLGGCVPNNPIRPDILPSQCEDGTSKDPITGQGLSPFKAWSPRGSVTYDVFGTGKTSIHASGSYFYGTKIVTADGLGGLFSQPALTWGPNQSSGACSTTAGAPCWTDANGDGNVQANELIGQPTSTNARFNTTTGIFAPAGNNVDSSAQLSRVREGIVGVTHEVISNMAVGVDYIYRKYDRGTTTYTVGFQPGAPGFPLSQIYTGPLTYNDPLSGLSAPYYVICQGCQRPSGAASIVMTRPDSQVYNGVDLTLTKRYSNRWQAQMGITLQNSPQYFPADSASYIDPAGREFNDGISTIPAYLIKASGSYTFKWDIIAAANFNANQGGTRTISINGPGAVYGGVNAAGAATTINKNTLTAKPVDDFRYETAKLLDLSASKVVSFQGNKRRVKLTFDAFNVFNVNPITSYSSDNMSLTTFTSPSGIVPPRVFRFGATFNF